MTNHSEIQPAAERSFVETILETSDHPHPPQPMNIAGIHSITGIPHYDPKTHAEGEHKHDHSCEHKHHEHPDAFHAYGDKLVGHSENAAAPIHPRPLA
ncbi:hypothetical protein BGZ58_010656 [Dissophora ornata]|nr:hypothetical protein BGZ58_010656 [Dissophora ornata]